MSFYSQSLCDSLKLEPCSALALADLQNDPHYHSVQRICRRNTNLPLFCTVKLLQAVRRLCQGQIRREDAAVPFFVTAAGSVTLSKPFSLPLLSLSCLMFSPFQKDSLKKSQTCCTGGSQSYNIYLFFKKFLILLVSVPTLGTRKPLGNLPQLSQKKEEPRMFSLGNELSQQRKLSEI